MSVTPITNGLTFLRRVLVGQTDSSGEIYRSNLITSDPLDFIPLLNGSERA